MLQNKLKGSLWLGPSCHSHAPLIHLTCTQLLLIAASQRLLMPDCGAFVRLLSVRQCLLVAFPETPLLHKQVCDYTEARHLK